MTQQVTVTVITTRNEGATVGTLVHAMRRHGHVIVVDAASEDDTVERARRAGAVVLGKHRMPIGPALMTGWRAALGAGATRVIQIDAGGSHDPLEAYRLWATLRQADIVVGSRFLPCSDYTGGPWWRPVGSRMAARACNLVQGSKLTDWTSGFRAFRAEALRVLLRHQYQAQMHGWQIEVLARALDSELLVKEVPITYRAGRSSFDLAVAREAVRVWHWMANDHWRGAPVQEIAR